MKKRDLVHVGIFGHPLGLKGEIKINIFTSSFESFKILKNYFLGDEKSALNFLSLRKIGKKYIATIEGCKDRNTALGFKNKNIYTFRENFPIIKDDEYYVLDLIGCEVINKEKLILGNVIDIKNFGASDLVEIKKNKKTFYIPMNQDNIINIDIIKRKILVDPMEGLLD